MPVSVTMPRLGESVSEGTVVRWLKKEGEQVEADEPLLEVSTDKVDTEIPAPAGGVLTAIKVGEDETVEVGVELAIIEDRAGAESEAPAEGMGSDGEQPAPAPAPPPAPEQPAPAQPAPHAPPVPAQPAQPAPHAPPVPAQPAPAQPAPHAPPRAQRTPPGSTGEPAPAYVTPLVRKLAAEQGVDLGEVAGTGVGGRIRKQDVLDATRSRAAAPGVGQPAPGARQPVTAAPQEPVPDGQATRPAGLPDIRGHTERMSRLRVLVAQRMVESLQVSAQLTTVVEVDVSGIVRLREQAKDAFAEREGVRLSFLPFFAIATVEALKAHPVLNSSIDLDAGTITYHDEVRLGIAVDTARGLLVPVIPGAGDLNLPGMARKIADLADRTRNNAVTPDELSGGTFTLTNTGSRGALFDTPIINQPQSAILGTGGVVKRPVVVETPDLGEIVAVRSMLYLALTYDHRVVDGADAARFLADVKARLDGAAFAPDLGL